MWNLLSAIGRKVQSFLPQAPPVSPKINVPAETKISQPPSQDLNKLSIVGAQQSPLQQAAQNNPQLQQAINQGAQAGGGPPTSGEGGAIQMGNEKWSSMEDYNKDLQRAREMGFSSPLELRNYLKQQDQLRQQAQAPTSVSTPVSTPTPTLTPTPVQAPPIMFNPQDLLKTIGSRIQQGGQSLATGLGNIGKSAVEGGSNMLGAVSRALGVQPAYSVEPGQTPEPAKGPSILANLPLDIRKRISTIGYKLGLGGAGISQPEGTPFDPNRTPENVYTQLAAGVYNPSQQSIMSSSQQEEFQKQLLLSKTPPPLDEGGGGGGGGNYQLATNPIANDFISSIIQELTSSSGQQQIASMPTEDLAAATQQMSEQMGIPAQQAAVNLANQEIMKLGDLIDNLDKDITETTAGSLMTEPQRRRLVAAKGAPLRAQLIQLMRTAQYAGIGLDNSMKMLSQYIDSKKATMDNQFRYAQLNQTAEDERKKRLLSTLPYLQPAAKELLPYQMQKRGTVGGKRSASGMTPEEAAVAAGLR